MVQYEKVKERVCTLIKYYSIVELKWIDNLQGGNIVKNTKTNFDQMKYEVANELGVNLKQGYNGDLTSKEAGRIGGNIVKKVFQSYTGQDYGVK